SIRCHRARVCHNSWSRFLSDQCQNWSKCRGALRGDRPEAAAAGVLNSRVREPYHNSNNS
ncbi:hypothetical protein FOZ63_011614, partial [Perkinsus olseni]